MAKYKVDLLPQAQSDMDYLARSEPAAYRKALKLMLEIAEHPRSGTGKPERLKGSRSGQWSRRITAKHRLVYLIDDDKVIVVVLEAAGHYN